MTTLIAADVRYFCDDDERMFFEFLRVNPAVRDYFGEGRLLNIEVEDQAFTWNSFLALFALFKRYDVDTRQLATVDLSNNGNLAAELRNPEMIWYSDIFEA